MISGERPDFANAVNLRGFGAQPQLSVRPQTPQITNWAHDFRRLRRRF
jgi:hypothetical protein